MNLRRVHNSTLRPDRLELSRLAWALGISAVIHLICWGGYELGRHLNVWEKLRLPEWLQATAALSKPPTQTTAAAQQPPLVFIDVDPQVSTADAPENARFYSSRNSRAANPEARDESDIPQISGTQTQVPRTDDVPRPRFDRLQPAAQPGETEELAQQKTPTSPEPEGDLAMARPDVKLRPEPNTPDQPRPRTIKEALMRQNRALAGEKMKQEGGVRRRLEFAGLDAKATAFGAYDAAVIEAIQNRWYHLLDNVSYDGYRRGRVVLQFHLTYDGRITNMKVVENSVGEMLSLLCQKAVLDPAPYGRWPRELRLLVDKDYREVQFAFYYN